MVKLRTAHSAPIPTLFPDLRGEISLLFDHLGIDRSSSRETFSPSLNVAEAEDHVEMSLDLPGVSPEKLQIDFKDGQLSISGERMWEEAESAKKWLRTECSYGKFERLIVLGDDVDAEQIKATYRDGVLVVLVPKAPRIETKRIEVQR